jgi:glucose-1-phosphate cytidylyltransferase
MKVAILAGGLGTRLTEETEVKPKPMVEIGGRPILWHIMKYYAHFGFKEFVIALGYKGEVIKRFFLDYQQLNGNLTMNLATNKITYLDRNSEDWTIDLVETGQDTMTGGRVKRLEPLLEGQTFLLTYGDGLSNVDPQTLLKFHREQGRVATITAVRPPARFGGLIFDGDILTGFTEKSQIGEGWINGGFMVCEPALFKHLDGDQTILESDALEKLASNNQLAAYKHEQFWGCMDTLRDVRLMQGLWHSGNPPWKLWK